MFLQCSLIFSSLFFGTFEAKVTCYNCRSYSCETGSCEGDFCLDQFAHNADLGTYSYQRGCYSPVAGAVVRKMNGDFDCSGSKVGSMKSSSCICQSNHCNGGNIHTVNVTTGPVKCATGKVGSVTGSCNGDSCRRGDQGLGCQTDHDFTNYQPFFPSSNFNGCYKISSSDGQDDEECSCKTNDCNTRPQNATYGRNLIRCNETKPFSPDVKMCSGNACFLSGTNIQGLNGYRRGCVMISGKEPIEPFCARSQVAGSNDQQDVCFCTENVCNADVDTAVQSMLRTTTTPTTSTTEVTTETTTKAAGSMLPSAVLLAVATFWAW